MRDICAGDIPKSPWFLRFIDGFRAVCEYDDFAYLHDMVGDDLLRLLYDKEAREIFLSANAKVLRRDFWHK